MRLRIPYSHTACASAFISTPQEEAVFNLAHIVPLVLNSVDNEFHTALASPSGDNSVNGDITQVICPRADISALADNVIEDSHVEKATAPSVHVPVSSILLDPFAYKAPTASHVRVRSISQIPVEDTTSDKSAFAVSSIRIFPSQFTPITAVPACDRLISENDTIYHAFRGINQLLLP